MDLRENMLLQLSDEKIVRIVFLDQLSSILYVINMEGKRWPYLIALDETLTQLREEKISIMSTDPYFRNVIEEELSASEIEGRENAWEIVNFVLKQVESENQMFFAKYRQKAIKQALEVYRVNFTTVKNYLIRYWKGGKIRNGLLPYFASCGAKGKERKISDKKRGRPRKDGVDQGINIDDKIQKYFRIGLNRYYYNERRNSLRTTYELIIKDFFTEKKVDYQGTEVPVIQEPFKIPTYYQFLYWYKKFNDPKKELINRNGSRNYFLNNRTIIGSSTQDAGLGPGTLWQIDSTQFDIYLISSVNRNLIVGRPTLICVIDVYSRMLVGINITFESFNSYVGTMVALANSMTSKKDFCLQYGIHLGENEWDVACVPQRIFADRGELNGKQIENAIEGLGISIQNSPPYRADYKGIIEQTFAQLNIKVKPFVDGVVKNGKNIIERGSEDYRLKANLTIDEFTRIIIKCVLFHNNHHVLSQYVLDEMMIGDEVEKIPAKIWEYGLKNTKGHLRTLPESTIKIHLLPMDSASITSRGVKFKKMLYASDYSLKNHWFQNARIYGSRKIKIWYDPRNMSHIYTINEDGEFHKLTLLEQLTKFQNRGIDEVNEIIKFEEKMDSVSKKKELQAKMKLFEDIEGIVGEGRQRAKSEKDDRLSKNHRLKGIRENQKMERERQRNLLREENNYVNEEEDEVVGEFMEKEQQDDELEMFRNLQMLDWDDDE